MSTSKLSKFWKFINKPLCVSLIIFIFVIFYGLTFGQKEKVRCDYMVNPDVAYLEKEWNMSKDTINLFLEVYSKPFRANWTFDSYQEALAYKQLATDAVNAKPDQKWYKPTLNCDEIKIEIPLQFKEIIGVSLKLQ